MQPQAPSRNPARSRGLRRARAHRAPCDPAAVTPIPRRVELAHLLALQTRVRAARIAGGELARSRRYDLRAFKTAAAELGYLHTLARAGTTGGTVVTSMPQLVRGLARLHPAWTMSGDRFDDRDRHQTAVRRRLRDLDAMGLLSWRIGVDTDGEDARTELELRPAPDVTAIELDEARAQLARWRRRYGHALNTGSATGVRNAARHARPLAADELERRGRSHAIARARARRYAHRSNTAPLSEAPATPENKRSANLSTGPNACGHRSGVTRAGATGAAGAPGAPRRRETAALRQRGRERPDRIAVPDDEELLARVQARQAQRAPLMDLIGLQALRRAQDVASWDTDRGWPTGRLREAWVVWRHGPAAAAEFGSAPAGPVSLEDLQRLRRAAGRYERHAAAAPASFQPGALQALAQIGAVAAARDSRPLRLRHAIRRLDVLSRRMRAIDTADDPARRDANTRRARRRHQPPAGGRLEFRVSPAAWPPWIALDEHGDPRLVDGRLVTTDGPLAAAPRPGEAAYDRELRDALLLAGLWLSPDVDGRQAMADRHAINPDCEF